MIATRRALLSAALLALLVVAQGLLLALTLNYESTRAQDDTESTAAEAASEVRREMLWSLSSIAVRPERVPVPCMLRSRSCATPTKTGSPAT